MPCRACGKCGATSGAISGGIGTRGPGETQLEEDRRLVDHRIRDLKHRLHEVQSRKEREVASRREEHTVSLVGYTNAGKSTLMNALTGADVYVENKLFSTLDTRTRQWHVKDWGRVLLSDTVGFIRELPHHLIASFKATLTEARQARLLLHVVDASNPFAEEQIKAVNKVLDELGCGDKPTLLVLNKVDRVTDPSYVQVLQSCHPRAVGVSATTRQGLDDLQDGVIEMLAPTSPTPPLKRTPATVKCCHTSRPTRRYIFRNTTATACAIRCHLPRHLLHHIQGPDVDVRFLHV